MTEIYLTSTQFSQLWDLFFVFSLFACFGLGAIHGGSSL